VKKNHAIASISERPPSNAPFVAPGFEEPTGTAMLQPRATTTRAMIIHNIFCLRTDKSLDIVGFGPPAL
jgi:hypothetical protein